MEKDEEFTKEIEQLKKEVVELKATVNFLLGVYEGSKMKKEFKGF